MENFIFWVVQGKKEERNLYCLSKPFFAKTDIQIYQYWNF